MEIMPFHTKEKRDPTGRPSTYTSSDTIPGARIVVSQYGGVASAAACSYDWSTVNFVNILKTQREIASLVAAPLSYRCGQVSHPSLQKHHH